MNTLQPGLCGDDPLATVRLLREVFLANHLASNDNLTRTTKQQNTQQCKLTTHKRGPNKQQHTKNMPRQTEPGLVAFYDIQPGNGADLLLQPQSLHGAKQK